MSYRIEYSKQAIKFLSAQPQKQRERIVKAIQKLPFEGDIKRMAGGEAYEYRLRVGDYRVIYARYDDRVLIRAVTIGNRGDVYK